MVIHTNNQTKGNRFVCVCVSIFRVIIESYMYPAENPIQVLKCSISLVHFCRNRYEIVQQLKKKNQNVFLYCILSTKIRQLHFIIKILQFLPIWHAIHIHFIEKLKCVFNAIRIHSLRHQSYGMESPYIKDVKNKSLENKQTLWKWKNQQH